MKKKKKVPREPTFDNNSTFPQYPASNFGPRPGQLAIEPNYEQRAMMPQLTDNGGMEVGYDSQL